MKNALAVPCTSLVLAALLALTPPAHAVDGVKLINQAKAMAGGATPGDAPGFPVTISQPGSYRLSGNLTVPNADTTAIEITASHVTLDLNGFAILGPTDCSGGLNPCAGDGDGVGITTPSVQFNITIRNGTIQGMGSGGILLTGDSHLVEYMHVRSNGGGTAGIRITASVDAGSSIVQHSTVQRNAGLGIDVSRGAVRYNVVDVNLSSGIGVSVGSASYNVVTRNLAGINLGSAAGAFGNVAHDNPSGNLIGGGANLGQNLCTGTGGSC
jgi:hypothetical protein